MNELFPGNNLEQELPPYSTKVINVQELSTEQREYWHTKGVEFLKDLDNSSFVARFNQNKPEADDEDAYNKLADRFLKNSKGPHYMVVITSNHTQEILASASLFDKLKGVPHCVEISFTSKIHGKGLGTELIKNAKDFLVDNDYSHVYGYFQEEGANLHVFNKVLGQSLVGNRIDGYYWRLKPEDELTDDQLITDKAIRTAFNLDIDEFNDENVTKNQRRKRRTKLINIFYRFIKSFKTNTDEA